MLIFTIRDFESFAEKGLTEKRQRLRFEHYDEKRQLKVKAIQNVLFKCHQAQVQMNMGIQPSSEALQVQALIEDLKRQKLMELTATKKSFAISSSPNKTQSKWASTSNVFGAGGDYSSDYTDMCNKTLHI